MKKTRGFLVVLLVAVEILVLVSTGCSATSSSPASGNNPDSPVQPGGAVPNVSRFIQSGNIAGADLETANIKAAARTYFMDNGVYPGTSIDLTPEYIKMVLKARYYFDSTNGLITRVESVSGGWSDIVFSLAGQKWLRGTPDGNHANDRDVP